MSKDSAKEPQPLEPGSVVAQIEGIVTGIIGRDAAEFLEFSERSSFIDDLEMDSIQIVHLAQRVNELYGDRVDFIGWLSAKPVDEILALTIGDVTAFVEKGSR